MGAGIRRGVERPPANQSPSFKEHVHTDTWLGYAGHVSGTGEVEHCCVKWKYSSAAPTLPTPI